ncbi:MAG: methionyl-tRNA formyltransferase [Vicinamibacterales bacterium]
MRILFLGTPQFAVPSLEALFDSSHEVVAVVTQPDRPVGRGHRLAPPPVKAAALARGVPVLQPTSVRTVEFLEAVRHLAPDLGVVVAYGRILPEALLDAPRLGMVNVHASLLPRHRGAAPIHRAVIAGDEETGVTIMRVVPELDAGPMLASQACPILPADTSERLEPRLAALGAGLLLTVVDRLALGPVEGTPQDAARATYAARLTKAEGLIDWSARAEHIANLVRGLTPWPLAYTFRRGQRLVLRRAHAGHVAQEPSTPVGTIVQRGSDDFTVLCGHGTTLVVEEVQPEGRRAMSTREYQSGHPVDLGERFQASA